ncbi:MAG: carbon-nitrogen hydrolase family protein [Gammaproteobacteria bacterium]|jgi:nitrilase|nr:carbon-nitrogen hydrolase family protein [Gammaproteobacteria bacterium]MDH3848236.1 carbon-nitrogen hydrolase family protein [Gammaproteobacteria bacterium]MDH3904189.1 carbon-nitrogen hydrolase family protein [Gammaproteobacteria bacterium]MDH3952895.1 carbon-nitrogen hydrolase family protein [Gammaproteobacteria bacterium]MDH4005864.1 carbon-nitrogen hydrolase family protein [Gammaproteobacteria bacterium]
MNKTTLKVGIAQIAPVWLDRDATVTRVIEWMRKAASQGCELVVFGEALIPGYPFWVERTDGARFESDLQKELYRHYVEQSVCIEAGDLDAIREVAKNNSLAVYVGVMERAPDRGGHSLYASMVYIDAGGEIGSVHRKLMPTYEERLVWAIGDGHGLRVHKLGPFAAGGLNCWENWLPLARAALYAQGEDLHVAIWPGNQRNTEDITRFIAREGRCFVVSVAGLMRRSDIPDSLPRAELLRETADEVMADGGSCIATPTGEWLLAPHTGEESLRVAELDHRIVLEERQSLDVAGHYSRPDVTQLLVDRRRQSTAEFSD